MAQVNVTVVHAVSRLNIEEVQRLQCRAENALATALFYVRSGATPEKIGGALNRVHRASDLLMLAQDRIQAAQAENPQAKPGRLSLAA